MKIDFHAQECEGYKAQYAHLAVILGEHEAKIKVKRDAFDELKGLRAARARRRRRAQSRLRHSAQNPGFELGPRRRRERSAGGVAALEKPRRRRAQLLAICGVCDARLLGVRR